MPNRRSTDEDFQTAEGPQPFIRFIPSLITIAGLCFGLSAIRYGMIDRWDLCISFIFVAALIDGLDGRAARMLGATSTFGAQLDSLSDFMCFGVAPVLILYMWALEDIKRFGWAVVLFYAICCALRLARFNTAIAEDSQKSWEKNFFVGIPSPAAGLLVLAPLGLAIEPDVQWMLPSWVIGIYVLIIGALMVTRIPTFAMKQVRIPTNLIIPMMLLSVLALVITMIEPLKMLILVGVIYLGSVPFSYHIHRKLSKKHAAE